MKTLYATRVKENNKIKTELRNESGYLVATYPIYQKQPPKSLRTIIHNCFYYNLIWQN